MFRFQHSHETQTRRSIKIAWIKKNRRNGNASFQLLQQRKRPVNGKKRAGPENKNNVPKRIRIGRHTIRDEIDQGVVLGKDGMDCLYDCFDALRSFGFEPFVERTL
jgi:hypothetical protein